MSEMQSFLKFISLYELEYWDVKRYQNNNLSFENAVLLKDILKPYKEVVSKEDVVSNKWRIISKINFAGELFLREFEEIETYKGKLYKVSDNSLIYSKMGIKHGSIYYHKKNNIPFVVSSEYPVFLFDEQTVIGEYIVKVLQSDIFKNLLAKKEAGAARNRVKEVDFLSIKIPLPLLQQQEEILEKYNAKIELAKEQKQEAREIEESIEEYFNKQIGIEVSLVEEKTNDFLRFINYTELEKWGVDKNLIQSGIKYTKAFPMKVIKDLCQVGSGGTPSRSHKEYYTGNIPWIKTGEVVNDIIYDSEEKITQEAIENSSAKLYPKDSLIIAMYGQGLTRGRTAKLGIDATTNQACAVLYDIDNTMVDIDYLWFYMMNEYHRLRELASGNNQPNLNAEMIKNYKVVIPDFTIQKEIVEEIIKRKEKIKQLKQEAQKNRDLAIKEFEREMFDEA